MANEQDFVLDDGEYYIEHNSNYPLDRGNGFLLRRCVYGETTPGGYECVGGYAQTLDGLWTADINHCPIEETDSDCTCLGTFKKKRFAVMELWNRRKEAFARYPRY